MQYAKEHQIGDQGEHLVAMTFIKLFGWPCRLQEVDTGIDAEYETTREDNSVTGHIVKLQVKTTASSFARGDNVAYVKQKHLDYWKEFSVPVVFCSVSLFKNEIMWTCVESEEDYRTDGAGHKLILSYPRDLLKAGDADVLGRIASRTKDPLFQMVRHAQSDMRRVWHEQRLLLDHSSRQDNDFFDALGEKLRHIESLKEKDPDISKDMRLLERITLLHNDYMAAYRQLNRLADQDCDARDG